MHFCKAPHLVGTSALPALYFRWGLCCYGCCSDYFSSSSLSSSTLFLSSLSVCLSVFFVAARKTWLIMQILISSGLVRLERLTSLTKPISFDNSISSSLPSCLWHQLFAQVICVDPKAWHYLSMTLWAVCLIQLVKHTHCGPALLLGG